MPTETNTEAFSLRRAQLLSRMRADVLAYFDKEAERWHNGAPDAEGLSLHDFLGLTKEEYAVFAMRPDLLHALLAPAVSPAGSVPTRFFARPAAVDAVQWFAMGDHPAVVLAQKASCNGVIICTGSSVLGYDQQVAAVRTQLGWREVVPGDWVVTDRGGAVTVWSPEDFAKAFEQVG